MELFGNELEDLFHGFIVNLTLGQSSFQIREKKSIFRGQCRIQGHLAGFSGLVPKNILSSWKATPPHFHALISRLTLDFAGFPPVGMSGSVRTTSPLLDLSSSAFIFPAAHAEFKLNLPDREKTKMTADLKHLEYHAEPYSTWKGHLNLLLDDTSPLIGVLQRQGKISWPASALAKVHDLSLDIDWESGESFSWLRFGDIHSSGIWTAYGSLMDDGLGLTGMFEAKVGGLPVGIRFAPGKTNITVLPGTQWYSKRPF